MNQPPLPTGCHDIKTAALLLGVKQNFLFKKLRQLGWIYTGTYKNDPYHNTPCRTARLAGWVTEHLRGYPAPYNKHVAICYNTTIITQCGLEELKRTMNKNNYLPKIPELTLENAQKKQTEIKTSSANEEREKALKELEEMGLYSLGKTG